VGRDDHLTLVGAVMRGGGEGIMARVARCSSREALLRAPLITSVQ